MPTLSDTQKNALQNVGALRRGGYATGPGYVSETDNGLYNAACWSWALTGVFTPISNAVSAGTIYQDIFNWANGVDRPPTSVNAGNNSMVHRLANTHLEILPLVDVLNTHVANAAGGNAASQQLCRIALLKITAIANGFTLANNNADNFTVNGTDVSDNALGNYALHVRSTNWYGWDHWGISVLLPNGHRSFIQKVNGSNPANRLLPTGAPNPNFRDGHVFKNCDVMWDEGLLLTSVAITGLLQAQVNIIIA